MVEGSHEHTQRIKPNPLTNATSPINPRSDTGRATLLTRRNNAVHHHAKFERHLTRSKPQRENSHRLQPPVATDIRTGPVTKIMANAVDLDGQPRGMAVEIENINPQGMLPPEFIPRRAPAQTRPEYHFGHREVTS